MLTLRLSLFAIDDFCILEGTYAQCKHSLALFQAMCARVGVPLSPDKTVGPSTTLTFLGVQLCTVDMVATLPLDKLWISFWNIYVLELE